MMKRRGRRDWGGGHRSRWFIQPVADGSSWTGELGAFFSCAAWSISIRPAKSLQTATMLVAFFLLTVRPKVFYRP
jgi:hypothetical protein